MRERKLTIEVRMESDALVSNPIGEITDILHSIIEELISSGSPSFFQTITDSNGNRVGQWAVKNYDLD